MKIRVGQLRRIIRETINEEVVSSAPVAKVGAVIRYTGDDMEMPAMMKVLSVGNGMVTLGGKGGFSRQVPEKSLTGNDFHVMN